MVALPQKEACLWRGICKIPKYQTIPGGMRHDIEGNFMNIIVFEGGTNFCKIQDKDLIVNVDWFFKQNFHTYLSWYQSFVLTSLQKFLETGALQVFWDPVTFSALPLWGRDTWKTRKIHEENCTHDTTSLRSMLLRVGVCLQNRVSHLYCGKHGLSPATSALSVCSLSISWLTQL